MSLNNSVLLLIIFLSLYLIIIEIFTVIFRMTGMTERTAKFQVISMLTNSGFTTNESEVIVSSRKRRKLAIVTMIFGYTFTVVIVSILVNLIMSFMNSDTKSVLYSIIYLISFCIVYFILLRFPKIRFYFDKFIKNIGSKFMVTKKSNPFLVLDYVGNAVIGEMKLTDIPQCLMDTSIGDAHIRGTYEISILTIKRNKLVIPNVGPDDKLEIDDKIILYGNLNDIYSLFSKSPSFWGNTH